MMKKNVLRKFYKKETETTGTEINKAKATFTGRSPRNNPATTAGHPEGNEPKPDKKTAKGGGGPVISLMRRIKRGRYGVKRDKGFNEATHTFYYLCT
jgi:hypothetical protein